MLWTLVILSAGSLILAFPQTDWWLLSWGALVPFMFSLDGKKLFYAYGIGYLWGVIFLAGTLYWFIHVTVLGAIILILFLANYYAVFGLCYAIFQKEKDIIKFFLLPSIWVVLEFIRGHLFTGFGWVYLGHSQYKNLVFIQMADVVGVYGISFVIVMVNFFLKKTIEQLLNKTSRSFAPLGKIFFIILGVLVFSILYGYYRLSYSYPSTFSLAVIQANVAQEVKWDPQQWPTIMDKYLSMTEEVAQYKPDFIIWPETSYPGLLWESQESFQDLKEYIKHFDVSLLFGAVTKKNKNYFNSAIFVSKEGELIEQYDKLHLVPFGEYIPLRKMFPFLSTLVPIEDFSAGARYTLFPIPSGAKDDTVNKKSLFFSVLICFEDTVPAISRTFVKKGSDVLVNITNDAWFQDTKEPFLHLQASVFRAIENRRSLVRSANTGISCLIDPKGEIQSYVSGKNFKKTYVTGYFIDKVKASNQKTFYTNYGDIFTYVCFGCILICGLRIRKIKK